MNRIKKRIAPIVLIILSICFIVIGAAKGDIKSIQEKGSLICWECIGLGK